MRGGAQAHLIEADDGHFYIVKFRNNPQHRRILVNEWIATVFLRYLQITTPETAIVDITPEFLKEFPEACIELGTRKLPPETGWHFGSRHPGDPNRMAVYDFLPDTLLAQVNNLREFLGALAFDKWISNADGRQSIFFRARLREWTATSAAEHPLKMGFVTVMIDHGFAFNGPHWDFPESPVQGLYSRKLVYTEVRSLDDFQPWLDRILHFPEHVVDHAFREIPMAWLDGDETALENLLEKLLRRRKRLPAFIEECRKARVTPFPNWS